VTGVCNNGPLRTLEMTRTLVPQARAERGPRMGRPRPRRACGRPTATATRSADAGAWGDDKSGA